MAALGTLEESPFELMRRARKAFPGWLAGQRDKDLGPVAIELREVADWTEAFSAEVIRRFEKSGAWAKDGATDMIAWLKSNGRLSGGAALERVSVARQLEKLPETADAFLRGDLGYGHVAIMTRTAEKVGTGAYKKEEASLLKLAHSMDPGRFGVEAKKFEIRVDEAAALAESNRAYSRRYLHLSEVKDGLVRLDGLLDAEGGAVVKTAVDALMPPPKQDDDRTAGQRRADALVDLARHSMSGSKLGSTGGMRPHLVITATVETLAGVKGAEPAELQGVGPIANETLQLLAVGKLHARPQAEPRFRAYWRGRRMPLAQASERILGFCARAPRAAGRRFRAVSGATGTTSGGGREAARRSCKTWRCYAAGTIEWFTKRVGRSNASACSG